MILQDDLEYFGLPLRVNWGDIYKLKNLESLELSTSYSKYTHFSYKLSYACHTKYHPGPAYTLKISEYDDVFKFYKRYATILVKPDTIEFESSFGGVFDRDIHRGVFAGLDWAFMVKIFPYSLRLNPAITEYLAMKLLNFLNDIPLRWEVNPSNSLIESIDD
jgi:hypothetical protein